MRSILFRYMNINDGNENLKYLLLLSLTFPIVYFKYALSKIEDSKLNNKWIM